MTTDEIIHRFNAAFVNHDSTVLPELVGIDCIMEAIEPAPEGARYEGRQACLDFWQALVNDHATQFTPEDVVVAADRATIRWRFRYGPGDQDYVRGVNLMTVRAGKIVEALGYSKTPASASSPQAMLQELKRHIDDR
jgi:ketosteroid isomerase-like protein